MIFETALFWGGCAFFLGCAAACPLCAVFSLIFKKHKCAMRFSLFCIFSAISVCLASLYLIFQIETYPPAEIFEKSKKFLLICAGSGFLISALWKIILIPAAVLYCILWISSWLFLSARFPEKKSFSIESEIDLMETEIEVCRIDSKFMIPIKRFWFCKASSDFAGKTKNLPFFLKDFCEIHTEKIALPKSESFPARWKITIESALSEYKIRAARTL